MAPHFSSPGHEPGHLLLNVRACIYPFQQSSFPFSRSPVTSLHPFTPHSWPLHLYSPLHHLLLFSLLKSPCFLFLLLVTSTFDASFCPGLSSSYRQSFSSTAPPTRLFPAPLSVISWFIVHLNILMCICTKIRSMSVFKPWWEVRDKNKNALIE